MYLVSFLLHLIIVDESINERKRGMMEEGRKGGKRERGEKERDGL